MEDLERVEGISSKQMESFLKVSAAAPSSGRPALVPALTLPPPLLQANILGLAADQPCGPS